MKSSHPRKDRVWVFKSDIELSVFHISCFIIICLSVRRFVEGNICRNVAHCSCLSSPSYNRHGWLGVKKSTIYLFILFYFYFFSPWYNRHGCLGVKNSTIYLFFFYFFFPPWYNRHGWLGVRHQLSIYLSCPRDRGCMRTGKSWMQGAHEVDAISATLFKMDQTKQRANFRQTLSLTKRHTDKHISNTKRRKHLAECPLLKIAVEKASSLRKDRVWN